MEDESVKVFDRLYEIIIEKDLWYDVCNLITTADYAESDFPGRTQKMFDFLQSRIGATRELSDLRSSFVRQG